MAVALLVLFGLGATLVEIPYLALSPGSAVALDDLVEVAGGPSFPPEGDIYLTTVNLGQVTLLEAVQGWLDPSVDVVERSRILPRRIPPSDLRDFNLHQMDTSKQQAVGVAFEQLGHRAVAGDGAEVVQVMTGSPADGVLVAGDVIVGLGDERVDTHHDVLALLRGHQPGEVVEVLLHGGDGEQRAVVTALADSPDVPGRAFLGATLRTVNFHFEFPFDIDIASDRIGGPSAGLAFSLQVLDVLTEGELTGGRRVAATGTIELDGSVGHVGGVAQKAAVVRRAGIDLFLVPRSELPDARRAGAGVRIEPVDTLADALRILAEGGGDPLPEEP